MNPIMLYNQQKRLQIGNGKQLFGYAGIFGQDLGCTHYDWCQVSLIDQHFLTHYIQIGKEDFTDLNQRYESLKVIPLRMFAREVLMDTSLISDFVSIPASKRHHHSFPGGLLMHSLESYWERGAQTLQYLLTWKESKGVCRFVSGNAIKMADRLSTSASLRSMAFKDKPDYFYYLKCDFE